MRRDTCVRLPSRIESGRAQQLRADDVERAALRRDAIGGSRAAGRAGRLATTLAHHPERQRPQAGRVAEGDHGLLRHDNCRERSLEPRHHVGERVLDALRLVRREQRRDDLRVGRAAELDAALAELGVQLDRVDEVAVVRERDLATVGPPDRLRVLPGRRAGCRIAHVPDRHLTLQRAQLLLVEDLRDEPDVAHGHDLTALADGDARRLLAAVLEREQGEVREPGDVHPGRIHAEDAALVARSVAMVELGVHLK